MIYIPSSGCMDQCFCPRNPCSNGATQTFQHDDFHSIYRAIFVSLQIPTPAVTTLLPCKVNAVLKTLWISVSLIQFSGLSGVKRLMDLALCLSRTHFPTKSSVKSCLERFPFNLDVCHNLQFPPCFSRISLHQSRCFRRCPSLSDAFFCGLGKYVTTFFYSQCNE